MACEQEDAKCRTCLAEYRNMISITADYIVHGQLITMADIIATCTSVQIVPNDNFPQYVCETCARDAIAAYSFKRQCERTDELLKSQLKEAASVIRDIQDNYCQICDVSFGGFEELTQHLTQHELELQCENCSLKFKTKTSLQEHVASEHVQRNHENNFTCAQKQTTDSLRAMRKTTKVEDETNEDVSESDNDLDESDARSISDEQEENSGEITPAINILKSSVDKNEYGLLQCLCCEEYFKSKRELQKHTRKHKSFKCKLCSKVFTIVSNLRRHLRAHGNENSGDIQDNIKVEETPPEFKCISCAQTFSRRKLLSAHLKTHKDFSCSLCTAKFSFPSNLRKHLRAHNRPDDAVQVWKQAPLDKRTCDICYQVFKYRPSMLKHKKKHNSPGKPCPYCDQIYETAIKLYRHMEEQHQREKNIVCSQCGKKFFREWNLKMHMIVHTGLKPFMCEVCGMSFALQGNLSSHRRLHTGIKPYKCQTCGKGFTQQAALRSHEAGHSNRRDYICPDCGKAFSRIGAMKNHRKRHDQSKQFPCYMCDKRFTFSSERKRHMIIHTGERKFSCEVCGRAFNRPTNLKVHMQIHTRDYRYRCNYCDKGFIQAQGLKAHILIHERKQLTALDKIDSNLQIKEIGKKLIEESPAALDDHVLDDQVVLEEQVLTEQEVITEQHITEEEIDNPALLYQDKTDSEDRMIEIVFRNTS